MTNENIVEIDGVYHTLTDEQINELENKKIYDMSEEELQEYVNEQSGLLNEKDSNQSNGNGIKIVSVPNNQRFSYDEEDNELLIQQMEDSIEFLINELTDDQKAVLISELLNNMTNLSSVDYKSIDRQLEDKYWDWNNTRCDDPYQYDYTEGRRVPIKPVIGTTTVSTWQPKKVYTKVVDSFCELAIDQYTSDIKIVFSPVATAKIFIMKLINPNIEFGGYLSYSTKLPNSDELFDGKDYRIEVEDLLLIPQTRSAHRIDYFEFDVPEFMEDWRKAKEDKLFTSARYHSHHTLSAFHSSTDLGEIKEMAKQKSKFFSVVTAFKDKPFESDIDFINFDYFFDNIEVDSQFFIPFEDEGEAKLNNAELGYLIETNVIFSEYTKDDLALVREYVNRFTEMEKFMKYKFPTINNLNKLVKNKILDETDVYYIRELLNGSDNLFNVFNDLFKTLSTSVSKDKADKQKKIIDQIKKLVK